MGNVKWKFNLLKHNLNLLKHNRNLLKHTFFADKKQFILKINFLTPVVQMETSEDDNDV